MALVSGIAIEIAAKQEKLKSGLSQARSAVASFAKGAADLLQKAFTGVGSLISNVLKKAFDEVGSAQNRLTQLFSRSQYLKTSIADVQALDFAVQKIGGSVGTFDVALRHMQKNISLATRDLGPAKEAFKELGLSADLLGRMNTFEQLNTIINAMKNLKDSTKQAGIEYQVFREHIMSTSGIMQHDLQSTKQEFDNLGVSITGAETNIIRLNLIARAKFNAMKEGFFNKFSIPIMDALTNVMDRIQKFIQQSGGIEIVAAKAADGILGIFQSVESALGGVEGMIKRLDLLLTEVLIKKNQFQGFGASLGQQASKGLGFVGDVYRAGMSGKNPKEAFEAAKQNAAMADTVPEVIKELVQLQSHAFQLRQELSKTGQTAGSIFDEPRQRLKDKIAELDGPFSSYNNALRQGIDAILQKSSAYTDSQHATMLKNEELAEAMDEASKAAKRFSENPQFGKSMQGILDDEQKRLDSLERPIPEFFKKKALEIHDAIAKMDPSSRPMKNLIGADIARLGTDVIQHRMDKPRLGNTRNMESIVGDLKKFLEQKAMTAPQKVDVNVVLTPDELLKGIIKIGNMFTDQQTIDVMKDLKSGNNIKWSDLDQAQRAASR